MSLPALLAPSPWKSLQAAVRWTHLWNKLGNPGDSPAAAAHTGRDGGRRAGVFTNLSREHMIRFVLMGQGYPQRPHHYGLRLDTDS